VMVRIGFNWPCIMFSIALLWTVQQITSNETIAEIFGWSGKLISSSSSSSSCSWKVRRVSCSLILKIKLVPPSLPRSSYIPSSFLLILYCLFGILFVSILCTCCSHIFWYCFISFTMFRAPVFSLIHWFVSLSSFVIPSKFLKNFIYAASKRCSSLFFSTQASLQNFSAALAVMLWILNFVSFFIFSQNVSVKLRLFCYMFAICLLNHFCILIHGNPSI